MRTWFAYIIGAMLCAWLAAAPDLLSAEGKSETPAKTAKASKAAASKAAEATRADAEARTLATQSQDLEKEAAELAARLVTAANDRAKFEGEAREAEVARDKLIAEETEIKARLYGDTRGLENVLAALMMLERQKPPVVSAHRDKARDAASAGVLLSALAPALKTRAASIRADLNRISVLRAEAELRAKALASAETEIADQRAAIEALIAEKRLLAATFASSAKNARARADAASKEAKSLADLSGRLTTKASAVVGAKPATADAAIYLWPNFGRVIRNFGAPDGEGEPSQGLVLATRRGSQVRAPFDAKVEFAGPWRSFGGVVILNLGDGVLVTISGLGSIYAVAGQEVLAGEPLGEMPAAEKSAELYLELRKDGKPTNPRNWFVGAPDRISG